MILRDQQIGSAIAVIVSGNDGPRIFELNLVEANVGSNILEPLRTEITEQPYFAFPVLGLADRDQIDPAIVVVVERGKAIAFRPWKLGKFDGIERFSLIVTPERYTAVCSAEVREGHIHPAIVVKIQNGGAHYRPRHRARPRL